MAGNAAARFGFGGDTLNTAVYLARRLGIATDYVTALGDDPLSREMVEAWRSEGVGTDLVARVLAGNPARTGARGLCEALRSYDLIYLSGITLSLYNDSGRSCLTH